MGSPVFLYSLTFPNSDPAAAVRPDRLAYLINAIACSAKVPIELVFISYIRANDAAVNFIQPSKPFTGIPTNCAAITSPSLRGRQLQLVATPSMLVAVHYGSPAPANPADPVFQSYTASIQGTAGATPINAPSGNLSAGGSPAGSPGGSPVYPEKMNISSGGIVGIIMGIVAASVLVAVAYSFYLNRRRRPISRSAAVVTETKWATLPNKTTYPPEARRH